VRPADWLIGPGLAWAPSRERASTLFVFVLIVVVVVFVFVFVWVPCVCYVGWADAQVRDAI
jgi:hypothetical protein